MRSASALTPKIFASSAAIQKYSGGCTNHGWPLKCMTTQSCESTISRATSPYAVSLLSQSVPMPSPGRVTSAANSAPRRAARAGTDRICWKIGLVYPVALSVRGRRALVVGGGAVAERKVRGLIDAHADVLVVAPSLTPPLAALAEVGAIGWQPRRYAPGDVAGAFIAFAATDDDATNASVAAEARAAGILVNDASDAERGDFATPAVHRSGPLTVTVDSGGLSPSFTKRIRDELAVQFGARYARAAAALGALRERVHAVVPPGQRAAVMKHFAERDIEELAAMTPGAVEHEVERAAETLAGVVPSTTTSLVCATRASALAMIQARAVMAALAKAGLPSTVLEVTTRGDAIQDRSIAAVGENVFVKELELALRERRADYAVHSCKDLPSTLPDDMALAAVTVREDARDAYCSERYPTFADLPAGARVGTSSPRRRAQLRALRDDLVYDDVRGNVDTRLRKLREGAVRRDRPGMRGPEPARHARDAHRTVRARRRDAGGRPRRARHRDAGGRRRRAPARGDPRRPADLDRRPCRARVSAHAARRLPDPDRMPRGVGSGTLSHDRGDRRGGREPGRAVVPRRGDRRARRGVRRSGRDGARARAACRRRRGAAGRGRGVSRTTAARRISAVGRCGGASFCWRARRTGPAGSRPRSAMPVPRWSRPGPATPPTPRSRAGCRA